MNTKTDVVYILGSGSQAGDEELRYSLRSLEKHMEDLGNVYVIGECPAFLENVRHIPVGDIVGKKWQNAFLKTRIACEEPEVSEKFLLMNDDFFMLSPFKGAEFPYYCYPNEVNNQNGRFDFSLHCPILLDKVLYSSMPVYIDDEGPVSPRSFYGNYYPVSGEPVSDCIVVAGPSARPFPEQVMGRDWFSISNQTMLDMDFRHWLYALYPNRSRFEKRLEEEEPAIVEAPAE